MGTLAPRRREVAERCLKEIGEARARIEKGLRRLSGDPMSREAFAIMNRAIARSNRRREAVERKVAPDELGPPKWRLFQIAFILLNLDGLADRESEDRPVVDLLFFPTGGGKTEAYLGLAAFAIARRRLANPGLTGAGLSVVMRYTLRLLTLDQLSRAAGLVCALELERVGGKRLGDWPIEIGLWVGGAVTPNRMGSNKDDVDRTLVGWLKRMKKQGGPTPLPLKACPWCGHEIGPDCFTARPNMMKPAQLIVNCSNPTCEFAERLPIVSVDEEIYRRLPAFMIATVDKFANVPWEGRSGAFFGHVDRHNGAGFYGAAEPREGRKLPQELPAIDLVIQDELHLISGPLGTVAGLYETAFDLLASRMVNGVRRGPKIVASTATVRRADKQIRALFGRGETRIFPPPGPCRHDSFFAETDRGTPGRLYLGVGAPGQGPKRVFLRTLQTLLAGAGALSAGTKEDPADPYLTALCYFNALRELGGARRIVDDEVRRNLSHYGVDRVREAPAGAPFVNRSLHETIELTSRVATDKVAKARKALGLPAADKGSAHVALATNMISVGLDIPRLGLMVVQGQPKTAAEYIQATSRVGRSRGRPGLVVTLLNLHKPRDRTHHEQFRAFHMSFYRAVEATSVTPFASRALDRALAAMLVAAVRHLDPALTPSEAAERAASRDEVVRIVRDEVTAKMVLSDLSPDERAGVLSRLDDLRAAWAAIADEQTNGGGEFRYDKGVEPQRLLQEPLKPLPTDLDGRRAWFAAGRSMRETEPAALLMLRRPDGSPMKTSP
ncbi:helicase-related protein [Rubellimicrobium rubrum]|uniref:helicase-related protein n=1 Tax=Rubellimicrobium rubrum TaxID=2585369 RepID=UPI001C3F49BD|nr:helicase-related protein [Rubellimicrobium rubrum]